MALTIGVLGASGGVGASTLTAALTVRARSAVEHCHSAVAVDLDPRGGLDVAFGVEHLSGPRWDDLQASAWALSDDRPQVRLSTLPAEDGIAVLAAGGAPPADWRTVVDTLDSLAAQADVVAVDCGPRPPAALLSRLDALVVLVRLTAKGLRDGTVVEERCELARTRAVLVTRGAKQDRSGAGAARRLAMPFLTHWADDPRIGRHDAQGILPGTRVTTVDSVADEALAMLQTLWLTDLVGRLAPDGPPVARWSA